MSQLKTGKFRHEVFGDCLKLENNHIELVAALEFGPRILHLSLRGKENIFYN